VIVKRKWRPREENDWSPGPHLFPYQDPFGGKRVGNKVWDGTVVYTQTDKKREGGEWGKGPLGPVIGGAKRTVLGTKKRSTPTQQ